MIAEPGTHYDNGSLRGAKHRDSECPALRGGPAYHRVVSDGTIPEWDGGPKWCKRCGLEEPVVQEDPEAHDQWHDRGQW